MGFRLFHVSPNLYHCPAWHYGLWHQRKMVSYWQRNRPHT